MSKNKQQIKFEADTSQFKKAINEETNNIKSLNSELKLNQVQLKGTKDSTDLLSQKVGILKQKYEEQLNIVKNTNMQYEQAVEIFGKNSKEADNLKNKLIQEKTAQENIANAINETNKKLIIQSEKFITNGENISKSGEKLKKYGESIENVGNKLSIVGAGIGALAIGSAKASISFESAFAGVVKTVNATTEELLELRKGILQLSKELPSSAVEISNVAEAAGQLGIKTENILSFSKTMIDLGNSTNMSSTEAATALARFANITNMSQKDFDKLGSTIVDLGNNFATTEAEIVEMALRLAGAGEQVGMSEGQILGLATALSSVGIEAEMGGSAISKVMVKMQSAVEVGGNKLNEVLKKTGMSLRDLELMSSNSSMDFKALAQSIGMTSTELKQYIAAGTNLEDFAKISGMTASKFKEQWGKDATSAMYSFIKGLGNAEQTGESAITMLTEMGLTEVRLRDSLLRAANAGELFNNAITTGTKAWGENVALTNEADKRYQTTESQLKILKNELLANAIALGDELKPTIISTTKSVKPFLENVTGLIKNFNNLSSTTKENIIKFGALAVALGPAVKIGGKLVSTTGSLISNYGKAIKFVGELSSNIKINTAQQVLATTTEKSKILTTTASTTATGINTAATTAQTTATTIATVATTALKVAMIALPIVGIITGIASLCAMYSEMTNETTQVTNKVKEEKEALQQLKEEQQKQLDSNLSEIENIKSLRKELSNLVDENGRVKKGYEGRVNFILQELNKALGTEYEAVDGIIGKYKELSDSIDTIIEKKKANAILETQEKAWKTAIENQASAISRLTELGKTYQSDKEKLAEKEKELLEEQRKSQDTNTLYKIANLGKEIKQLKENGKTYEEQKEILFTYYNDISTYETNATLVASGNAEDLKKVNESVLFSYQNRKDGSIISIQEQINIEQTTLKLQKEVYEKNQSDITQNQIIETNNRLKALGDELIAQTNITTIKSPDVIMAWNSLANASYDTYAETISKMSPEMQQEIQGVTGAIVLGTPAAEEATKELSKKITDKLDNSLEARTQAVKTLEGYLDGLTDEEKRELLKKSGIENVDEVMNGLKEGNIAEEEGTKIIKSLCNGLNDKTWQGKLFGTASSIASNLSSLFSFKTTVNGKSLPGHKNGLDYVPYDNYVARLHEGERVLTKKENREYIGRSVENKVASNNIVVNFYTQTMSNEELEKAERYIARKWGMRV